MTDAAIDSENWIAKTALQQRSRRGLPPGIVLAAFGTLSAAAAAAALLGIGYLLAVRLQEDRLNSEGASLSEL